MSQEPSGSVPSDSPPSLENLGNINPRALGALYRISSLISRTEDPHAALRTILTETIAALDASSGSISLVNPDTGKLEIEVQQGLPDNIDDVRLRPGQGITGWVSFHGKAQLIRDVKTDPRYITVRPSVRCEMAAPMEENGHIIGVINVDHDQIGAFDEHDLELLVLCTREATAVTARLWRLQQLRGKARQLESLIAIGQSLVTKLEPQELYDTLTRDTFKILQCRAGALYLHDEARDAMRVASLANVTPDTLAGTDVPLDSCFTAAVINTRKALEYANINGPEYLDLLDIPRDPALRTALATPVIYENEILGVLAVFTDQPHRFNDEEKRLLAALASLAAVAVQNSRLYSRVFESEESVRKNEQLTTLGLLAAEIAHEIRNPLTVIKLLYGHLGLDFPPDDPRHTDVRVIREKFDQLEAIVTRVLNFAKAPSSLHSRWAVTDLIEDTIVLIRLKLAQSKIHLHFETPSAPLFVEVNKGQLQQVLLNILLNSTQAMPNGGQITISCHSEERDTSRIVLIDIADTGRGVPEDLRDKIFDSFLTGRPDGTGLGLGIAKRILLSHHGDITLLSTSKAGTTMRLALPQA